MMNFDPGADFDCEIERTVGDNKLSLRILTGAQREVLILRLYDRFVVGNPAQLWLGLKHPFQSIDCRGDDPYFHLAERIDADRTMYLFLDGGGSLRLLTGSMQALYTFIGDCEGCFEFYLTPPDFSELYCVTDHDDFLWVDLRQHDLVRI